jgi:Mitochondrial carrier protein
MFQVTNEKFSLRKFPHMLINIYKNEGILALWKGHSAAILRVFPYSGIQFATFDFMKRVVSVSNPSNSDGHLSLSLTMFCGGTAAAISSITTYPLDLTRARLAVIPQGLDSKPFRVVRYIRRWYGEGGLKELYRGITPTLLGVIPYGAIAFTVNETGKKFVKKVTGNEPVTWHKLICGAFAGKLHPAPQPLTYCSLAFVTSFPSVL